MSLQVELCEVGPRDGFQFEKTPIETDDKLRIIRMLVEAGLPRIQVTSFVHPKYVPQMADAEEVIARLPGDSGAVFSGLALNTRGVRRAIAAGLTHVDLSIATNEKHSRDNANMTVQEGIEQAEQMIEDAHRAGLNAQLNLQTVFGYSEPGDTNIDFVIELARRFRDHGLESFSLADSTGMAHPRSIREVVRAVQDVIGDLPLVLHLHDTRGLGLANIYAAIEEGVRRFDTSVGGLGGCPFIPGATGNVATEDVAYMLNSIGTDTGIDPVRVADAALKTETVLGRELPGHVTGLRRLNANLRGVTSLAKA